MLNEILRWIFETERLVASWVERGGVWLWLNALVTAAFHAVVVAAAIGLGALLDAGAATAGYDSSIKVVFGTGATGYYVIREIEGLLRRRQEWPIGRWLDIAFPVITAFLLIG